MQTTLSHIRNSLASFYAKGEIESFIAIIFRHLFHYSRNEMILNANRQLSQNDFHKIEQIVSRLMKHEPIQYILGETEFYNLIFKVTPDVLIPRNETEELVDLILKNHPNEPLKVLDIGTGSGCIPIALKKFHPKFKVYSCDVSEKALNVAIQNATDNKAEVHFFRFDVLGNQPLPFGAIDILVSNPPYVTEKEKLLMAPNVLENEPHLALFVPDNDPLLFYREITMKALDKMKQGGHLYFEINEKYGPAVCAMLTEKGFTAELLSDINGKERMVRGVKG